MPERIQQILNRIMEWWKHFSTRQKALIISIAAVVAVAFSILGFVMTRPTMVNLITCDSAKQASSVKDLLDSNKTVPMRPSSWEAMTSHRTATASVMPSMEVLVRLRRTRTKSTSYI